MARKIFFHNKSLYRNKLWTFWNPISTENKRLPRDFTEKISKFGTLVFEKKNASTLKNK
jgi:hypothetical protein